MQIEEGEVLIPGRSHDVAKALLAVADDLGLDYSVVRANSQGYYVPQEVADLLAAKLDENVDATSIKPRPFAPTIPADEKESKSRFRGRKDASRADEPFPAPKKEQAPEPVEPAVVDTRTPEQIQADEDAKFRSDYDAAALRLVSGDDPADGDAELLERGKVAGFPEPSAAPAATQSEAPKANASREEWAAYVKTLPNHDPADIESQETTGLGRNDLAAKYGPTE